MMIPRDGALKVLQPYPIDGAHVPDVLGVDVVAKADMRDRLLEVVGVLLRLHRMGLVLCAVSEK